MRRFVLPLPLGKTLPLFVETVGTTIEANRIVRTEGYPHYHWLQTVDGEGRFTVGDHAFPLPAGSGVLVPPGVPHIYESAGGRWDTAYLTFGGPAVPSILQSLGLTEPAPIHWEPDDSSPMNGMIDEMMDRLESDLDLFGLNASADAYRFLLTLRQHWRSGNRAAIIRGSERLRPLLDWMEEHYSDAEVGLEEMQRVLDMPISTMNVLFRHTFGVSPYAYLIHLRLRKAKELLIGSPSLTVKMIAERVGFRDASHFVATFRRKTGLPPEQFRKLYE
ncbi:AraC family transcriptional regulator [Cohnella lubricantis]|uniref:AraC family transcriptional regulator n=1 Tax=Cohnella lubricantis TaxID=2163172 RepID=A0A841T6D8_9BACL|nr:AraC family transcriptional regulator [Cohnella lubricantis]MBB6676452.1 AraC family transcriptional regulator [Cohnella lubricantis]MBP2117541.1 AraC-like DNA-binding protein [Cohnella lubricantis]